MTRCGIAGTRSTAPRDRLRARSLRCASARGRARLRAVGDGAAGRAHYAPRPPAPEQPDRRGSRSEERRLRDLPHRDRPPDHARKPGGDPRLHRLPRRRRDASRAPRAPAQGRAGLSRRRATRRTCCRAIPRAWNYPSSANPQRSYTLLNREAPEFVRFINPGDSASRARPAAPATCAIIQAAERSLMATAAMFWGGAVVQQRHPAVQALHPRRGLHARRASRATLVNPVRADDRACAAQGHPAVALPAAGWETVPPADIFRVFERGGRMIGTPVPRDRPAQRDRRSCSSSTSRAGPTSASRTAAPAPALRIAVPVLNIHKTRLNDPLMWFLGTNDQPGDYRSSGCTALPRRLRQRPRPAALRALRRSSATTGRRDTADPTIPKDEAGPSARARVHARDPDRQCMVCHMHQPNMFMNTYLGYTMWDYESDAPFMWPEKQKYPTAAEMREILDRNPEEAPRSAASGATPTSCENVSTLNPKLKDTQFADYHGHGWNFRAVFKRDRKGNLLDKDGKIVADDDPEKFKKAVHLHVDPRREGHAVRRLPLRAGRHGNGQIYGEVADAVEIGCRTATARSTSYPTLRTSGPAAPPAAPTCRCCATRTASSASSGAAASSIQRSAVDPDLEWDDDAGQGHGRRRATRDYNAKAARAKLDGARIHGTQQWGAGVPKAQARARRRQDGLLHLPHFVDDELRRLPPADPGELEDRAPPLRGRRDAQLRDLQPAGRARRHVPARHATARSRTTRSRRCARPRRWCCRRPTSTASASTSSSRRSRRAAISSQAFAPHYPAHRAHDRDQDLHRLPRLRRPTTTTRSWRSCCC